MAQGRHWFIHCIYEIQSTKDGSQRQKRHAVTSVDNVSTKASVASRRVARSAPVEGIGQDGRGTNMHVLSLDYSLATAAGGGGGGAVSGQLLLILGGLLLSLVSSLLLGLLVRRRWLAKPRRSAAAERHTSHRTAAYTSVRDREMALLSSYSSKLPPGDDLTAEYAPLSPTTSCVTISARSQASSVGRPGLWSSATGLRWGDTLDRAGGGGGGSGGGGLRSGRLVVRAAAGGGTPLVLREYLYDEESSEV